MAAAAKPDGMAIVNEHIGSGVFSKLYVFTGDQQYLISQYVKKLSNVLTDTSPSSMNYMKLNKEGVGVDEIAGFAMDMPFFADRKVVEVWNSGFFKKGNEQLEDVISELPDTTTLIFVETEIDERLKTFKLAKEIGSVIYINTPDENMMLRWLKSTLKSGLEEGDAGFEVEDKACFTLLDAVGNDMKRLASEAEKIKCYCLETRRITADDVEKLCVSQVEGKVFDMIDALSKGDKKTTIRLYDDLMSLKEPPFRVLALINKQYERLLKVKVAVEDGADKSKIASFAGLAPFLIGKYMAMANSYTSKQLMDKLVLCQDCEIDIKTGRVRDVRALEMLVLNLLR